MEYLDKYIPKEYLALKINYCKKRLRELPKTSMEEHHVRGLVIPKIRIANHKINLNSARGQELFAALIERENLEQQLKIYEAIWDCNYKTPPPEYDPPKIVRTIRTGNNEKTVMDNYAKHDPHSPLLIGNVRPEDEIHKAEQKSWIDGQLKFVW